MGKNIVEQHDLSAKDALLDFWRGFISFKGHTTRKGFWLGVLEYLIITFISGLILGYFSYNYAGGVSGMILNGILYGVILILQIPLIALAARRLQDAGMQVIPLICLLILNYVIMMGFAVWPIQILGIALIVCQAFLVILFCIPTGAMKR